MRRYPPLLPLSLPSISVQSTLPVDPPWQPPSPSSRSRGVLRPDTCRSSTRAHLRVRTGPHWGRCNVMEPLSLDNFIIGHWRRPFNAQALFRHDRPIQNDSPRGWILEEERGEGDRLIDDGNCALFVSLGILAYRYYGTYWKFYII